LNFLFQFDARYAGAAFLKEDQIMPADNYLIKSTTNLPKPHHNHKSIQELKMASSKKKEY
jgi:predicted house-cleaning NTP pyrophosphatase (Maf/HAM1 superfamily)